MDESARNLHKYSERAGEDFNTSLVFVNLADCEVFEVWPAKSYVVFTKAFWFNCDGESVPYDMTFVLN